MQLKEWLEKEFEEWFAVVYKNVGPVPDVQKEELRKAFFSGVHVLNNISRRTYRPELTPILAELLGIK